MIRIGMIGCGRIVELGHAPGIKEIGRQVKVTALADVAPANLKQIGDMLAVPAAARYADYRDLLRCGRKNIDVAVLSLPHALHKPILIETSNAGYAILTEKPLTVTLQETRDVFRALQKNRTYFGIVHNYWRTAHMQTIVAAVRAGKIGEPFLYRTEGLGGSYWPGAKSYRSSWRSEARLGGRGCLLDNGYHQVYTAERIVGSPIVSAFARIERYNRKYSVEDTALVLLRHKNGATTSLQVGWSVSAGGQGVGEVHGARGSISVTKPDVGPIAYYENKAAKWVPLKQIKPKLSPYAEIYADFVKAFETGRLYVDNYAAAWNNMAILEAAYRSSSSGREEKVRRWE